MTIQFLQKATATGISGDVSTGITTPAFGSGVTAGNVLLAQYGNGDINTGKTITFTDAKGNTWTTDKQINNTGTNGGYAAAGSANIVTGGTSETVKASCNDIGISAGQQLVASEFSGLTKTVDQSASGTATVSTTSLTVTTSATTNANDLVIGCWAGDTNSVSTGVGTTPTTVNGVSITGGNVLEVVQVTTVLAFQAIYDVISSTGTQAVKWTYASDATGGYEAVVVVYQGTALIGGGTQTPVNRIGGRPGLGLGTPWSKLRGVPAYTPAAATLAGNLVGASASAATVSLSGSPGALSFVGASTSAAVFALSAGFAITGASPSSATVTASGGMGFVGASASSATVALSAGIAITGASASAATFDLSGSPGTLGITGASPSGAVFPLAVLSSGAIAVTGASASSGTFSLSGSPGVLAFTGASASSAQFPLQGTGLLSITGASVSSGTFSLQGTGALSLTGASASAGRVDLSGSPGTLTFNGASVSAAVFSALPLSSGSIFMVGASASSALFDLQFTFTPPVVPPTTGGGLLPGKIGEGMGPYKRPGQVFGEQDPVSPFLTSAPTVATQGPSLEGAGGRIEAAVETALDCDELALILLLALEETNRRD